MISFRLFGYLCCSVIFFSFFAHLSLCKVLLEHSYLGTLLKFLLKLLQLNKGKFKNTRNLSVPTKLSAVFFFPTLF